MPRRAMQAAIVGLGAIVLAVGASFSAAQAGGAAVALLAVASTGASALLARRELRSVSPLVVTSLLLGAAALLLFLASVVFERGQPVQWNRSAIGSLIFLALVAGAPAYALYFWLLQQLEAYKVATVQWIEPLVAMIEAAFFLRLGLSFSMIAGSLVTLASLLLVMRARAEDDNTVSLLGNSVRARVEGCDKLQAMGATLYIVVEGEDPGFDIFVNGRALARNEDALEKMAQRIGVKPLLEFFSADENSMALLLEEGAGDPEWAKTLPPPQWFSPEDGLITVCTLLDHLKARRPRWEPRPRQSCARWKSSSACCARQPSARCAGNWP